MNVLVIGAHPDDESFGMGGTIATHTNMGDMVSLLILTEGATVKYGKLMVEKHKNSAERAASILGVSEVVFGNFGDQKLDVASRMAVIKPIEEMIARTKPEIIYTMHGGDLNLDHRIVFDATLVAARPLRNTSVRKVISYETPSSTEWAPPSEGNSFRANLFVNIEKTLQKKLRAVRVYRYELGKYPHPRSVKAVTIRAQYWGSTVGLGYAEAFKLVREIRP